MFETLIRQAMVLTPTGLYPLDVALSNGKIAALLQPGSLVAAQDTIDAPGLHLLPGAIDIHFHVRAPAHPQRGTWVTESRAAAAGGVTTVFEMPISKPCCATAEILESRKAQAAAESVVNFAFYGAPGRLIASEVEAMAAAGAIGFKVFTTGPVPGREDEFDGLCLPDEEQQLGALELVRETGLPLVVHAESNPLLEHYIRKVKATGRNDPATHGESRPAIVEALAIAKIAAMNAQVGARLHIAHVTSALALHTLERWLGSQDISGETCPQYLLFTEAELERYGSYAKINPPLRTLADNQALWEGLQRGSLQHVTTDHSPFTVDEKERARTDIWAAPPGAPGVEVLLPMMLDAVNQGRLSLEKAVDLISGSAARRFGLEGRKGVIQPGADADLVLVHLGKPTKVNPETSFSQARHCDRFFAGHTFSGKVERTLVAGQTVFVDGQVVGQPGQGRFVRP